MLAVLKRQIAPGVSDSPLLAALEADRKLAKKQKKTWNSHFMHCSDAVTSALSGADPSKPVQIFTHGMTLADLPLDTVSQHDSGARLSAPIWWPGDRRKIASFGNLEAHTGDISNYLEAFQANPHAVPPDISFEDQGGLLISHMILAYHLTTLAPLKHLSDGDIDRVQALTSAHLSALENRAGRSVLIAPYARYENRTGKSDRVQLIPKTVLKSDPDSFWTWHYGPRGTLDPTGEVHLAVGVWTLNP